jgi:GntR family transcriptional regulator
MDIIINVTDGVPIYRQIVNQVKYLVASGLLLPGDELPPIRTLALQLKVTPNTIVKAYGELEISGVVHSRRGSGRSSRRASAAGAPGGAASSSSASTPCWPRRTS